MSHVFKIWAIIIFPFSFENEKDKMTNDLIRGDYTQLSN